MNAVTQTETKTEVVETKRESLGEQLKKRETQFTAALPAHMPVERFMRVVLTAVQNNPALANADRAYLWNSCMRAAQDGLLPDGRDGALVIYRSKSNGDWIDKVQWMPMIGGLRKKVRNSGEIKDWNAHVVYAKDQFEFELGDEPFIRHKPFMGGDPGPVIAAYSVAQFKSGEKSREVMTRAQIEQVRAASKSKDKGPWVDWFDEMCRKTVARRHAKVLPMSTDLDDLIRRDDALYDLDSKSDKVALTGPRSLADKLDLLASGLPSTHDTETGEIIDQESTVAATAEQSTAAAAPIDDKGVGAADPSQAAPASEKPKAKPPAPSPEERRKAILADLVRQGDEIAESGERALDEWIDNLTGDEQALLTPAQRSAWKQAAVRASS